MTRITLLSYRQESETTTYDNSDIINDTNVSDISTDEVTRTTSSNEVEVESLRNYDTEQSATVELVNFESLELQIHELITTELDTQIKLDELIAIQKQNFIVNYSLMFVFIFLSVMIVIYKFIAGTLFF